MSLKNQTKSVTKKKKKKRREYLNEFIQVHKSIYGILARKVKKIFLNN